MKTLVIVPTYDEAESLPLLIEELGTHTPDVDILVVDDNSPDGTGDIAEEIAREREHVHVLHRQDKEGLGVAYRAGFFWALERDYELIVEMDADGSHRARDLPRLLERAAGEDVDLVLGSRWIPGGGVVNWPRRRRLLSQGGTWYARKALKIDVADATGGFRVFRRATLEKLPLDEVASHGYCFQVDLVRRVIDEQMVVAEVPITFVERAHGHSKMSGAIVTEALWRVTAWGYERRASELKARLTRRQRNS